MNDHKNGTEPNGQMPKRTLVEEGTELRGTLSSKCPVVVMGRVEGDITAPTMYITETGSVSGKVTAKELHSQGEIAGQIEADVIALSGRVKDQSVLRAKTLEVNREGGTGELTFGECDLEIGDVPDKASIVGAATASLSKAPSQPKATEKKPGKGDPRPAP